MSSPKGIRPEVGPRYWTNTLSGIPGGYIASGMGHYPKQLPSRLRLVNNAISVSWQ
ncbi:MAG: hypothetical protein JOY54_00840 [Acidobacteriaceae bacterium]|nr:hypothetical protein [Acidobacteriaceae bacterium]